MKTKNILITAFAVCLAFITLSSCKDKKQATQAPDIVAAPPAPPAPPTAPAPPVEAPVAIEYRRGACFGTCPIFNLKVYQDGRATYEGKNFVDMIGFYYTNFDKKDMDNIMSIAESIRFFEMQDEYDNKGITDLPSTYFSLSKDGKVKQVKNRYQGPKELKQLYEAMDQLIAKYKWVAGENPNKD